MSLDAHRLDREEVAKIEVGQTTITRGMTVSLVAAFLATIFTVPLAQNLHEFRAGDVPRCYDIFRDVAETVRAWPSTRGPFYQRVRALNAELLGKMHRYESELEDRSLLTQRFLSPAQWILLRVFGVGNEKAYAGRDGWLFYRPDIDYLTGPGFLGGRQLKKRMGMGAEWKAPPQPDPRKAITDFKNQLAKRGITLVVMPTPAKSMIQPGEFVAAYTNRETPLQNPSYTQFLCDLEKEGVLVFDVADALAQARQETGKPQYFVTDTHWRPEAVGQTAKLLREFIGNRCPLPRAPAAGYDASPVEVTCRGDIAAMLKLPADQTAYPPEKAVIRQVVTPRGELWRSSPSADTLVLGDSFCNIFSLGAMGWGEAAGLVEQLSLGLQRPVDRIVANDNGSYATRAALARELARGRDRLAGKKLVIWQFAARELTEGDWKWIDLSLGKAPVSRFVTPQPGAELRVRGVVAAVSGVPRPGTAPYKDHVLSIHLVDVAGGPISNGQAVVYVMSMKDNVWTAAAQYRPGDETELKLKPWSDVSTKYDGINRSELEDGDLQLQEPCWGEPP
jgi:hypothetical protein